MKKVIFCFFILSVMSISSLQAQQVIDPTVEVKRDYQGKLMEITKSVLNTTYSDTLNRFNLEFDYSIFDSKYRDFYEFSPLQAAQLKSAGVVKYPTLYAKLSAFAPISVVGDIALQHHWKKGFSISAFGSNDSYFSTMPLGELNGDIRERSGAKVDGTRVNTRAGVLFSYAWKKGEMDLDVGYNNSIYSYSGFDVNVANIFFEPHLILDRKYVRKSLSHNFESLSSSFVIRSTNVNPDALHYRIKVENNYLRDLPKLDGLPYSIASDVYFPMLYMYDYKKIMTENNIGVDIELKKRFKEMHNVLFNVSYDIIESNAEIVQKFSQFELFPNYRYISDKWNITAGLKMTFSNNSKSKTNFFPFVYFNYELFRDHLWLHAKIDGQNIINSYSSLLAINPWVATGARLDYTVMPTSLELGFSGAESSRFSYNLYYSYSILNNLMVFGKYISLFVPNYIDTRLHSFGGELLWKSKDLTLGVKGNFNNYFDNTGDVSYLPKVEASVFGRYNLKERIIFDLNLMGRGGISVNNIPGYIKVDATLTYVWNSTISVFVEGKNILNSNIQHYSNYFDPGIRIGGGIFLKL